MARASFHIPGFLGGEWSPRAQGKISDPRYSTAMNLCLNAVIYEEGAWGRRSCFGLLGTSYNGYPAKLLSSAISDGTRALIEVTFNNNTNTSLARVWCRPFSTLNGFLVGDRPYTLYCDAYDTAVSVSTANPAVLTTTNTHAGWASGDQVQLYRFDANLNYNLWRSVAARQFQIVALTTTTFALYDPVTGFGIDGTTPELQSGVSGVGHIKTWAMPYTNVTQVNGLRATDTDALAFLFDPTRAVAPQRFAITYPAGAANVAFDFPTTSWGTLDGPYIDPLAGASQTGNSTGSISFSGGTYTFQVTDGAYTFTAADVGKALRLWFQPPAWSSGGSYAQGSTVTYNGNFWVLANTASGGAAPGQSYTSGGVTFLPWQLDPTAGHWSYGQILTFVDGSHVTVSRDSVPNGVDTSTAAIDTWQLGLYTAGVYPTCGCWHEGRLWLGGAIPNRFDATVPNPNSQGWNDVSWTTAQRIFSPTDQFGNLVDASAIAEVLNAKGSNEIIWMVGSELGVLAGARSGEWQIGSSTTSDPITPTNIRANPITKYGSLVHEPVRVGAATIFVQSYGQQVLEYLASFFTGAGHTGRPLNTDALHLAEQGFVELVYNSATLSTLWARGRFGGLFSCTYRRISPWGTEPPAVYAWAKHLHGKPSRTFESMCEASDEGALYGSIAVVTTDVFGGAQQDRYIEFLFNPPNAGDPVIGSAFCDQMLTQIFGSDQLSGGGGGGTPGVHGKYYFEVTQDTSNAPAGTDASWAIGIADPSATLVRGLIISGGTDAHTAFYTKYGPGNFYAASLGSGTFTTAADTQKYGVAIDTIGRLIWIIDLSNLGAGWNAAGSGASPAAGTGGYSFSGLSGGTVALLFGGTGYGADDQATLNTVGPFAGVVPSGFSAWGSVAWQSAGQNSNIAVTQGSSSLRMTISNAGQTISVHNTVNAGDSTWTNGATYAAGAIVCYQGHFWQAQSAIGAGQTPGVSAQWAQVAIWAMASGAKASP